MTTGRRPSAWQQRLWALSEPNENGCWIWIGSRLPGGYGMFQGPGVGGRRKLSTAHRWAYVATHGSVADDHHVDHLCNMPACINPAHLEAVTPQENIRRRDERRRRREATA